MFPQAKPVIAEDRAPACAGLYVHVPFCATSCDFCAFYQEKPRRADLLRYLDGIERELDHWCAEWHAAPAPHDPLGQGEAAPEGLTVFFGGGTPGLLAAPELARLCQAVRSRAPGPIVEWTVELAPSTVKPDKVAAMLEAGVTRVSLGAQSFDERLLEAMGRRHAPSLIRQAYATLREGGCANVNLDLIFAVPGQSQAQWDADLDAALALAPEHLSTYCLTFEEDTKLWAKLARGEFRRDEAAEAALYRHTWERLAAAGYPQYEVSNFARPGRACAHNLATWRMGAWRGVGPSAASQWQGARWSNPADLEAWLASVDAPPTQPPWGAENVVPLTPALLAADALIFGLRLNAGVDLAALVQRFPTADWPSLDFLWRELEAEGALVRTGDRITLTNAGRLLADAVAARVLDVL